MITLCELCIDKENRIKCTKIKVPCKQPWIISSVKVTSVVLTMALNSPTPLEKQLHQKFSVLPKSWILLGAGITEIFVY